MKKTIGLSVIVGLLAFKGTALAQYVYTPTNVAGAAVSTVVPDMLLWYSYTAGYNTNGPIYNLWDQAPNKANWEPYISVLGNSVFLVGANTFAEDGTLANQRFILALQPVAGGAPRLVDAFYADNGTPFTGQINLSRQDGNPQRVAGDQRLGATNYITAAEASCGQIGAFGGGTGRWATNTSLYAGVNRYVCAQTFGLNPTTLVPTPLTQAWEREYNGKTAAPPQSVNAPQYSRTGGTVACLDNGNFVVMPDDKTGYIGSYSEVASFVIITPTGGLVKGPTLVDARDIWDNLCAYKGGFAIHCHNMLYFFDDNGNFKFGQSAGAGTDINLSSKLSFDTGRGDPVHLASHINSRYVYLVGLSPSAAHAPCAMAIWDTQTGLCVATNVVSDTNPSVASMDNGGLGGLAVDAADRFCVAYGMTPDPTLWTGLQVAARVGQFNGRSVAWLTPSFYPFVNSENDPSNIRGFTTFMPSVAMTTDYICIAAKGTLNSTNNPASYPDTAPETTVYTVITQPVVTNPPPKMTITSQGTSVVLSWAWTGPGGGAYWALQKSPTIQPAAWSFVTNVVQAGTNYYSTNAIGSSTAFFRLVD